LKILIIENHKKNPELWIKMLTVIGHRVDYADSFKKGKELAKKNKPDLVISNVGRNLAKAEKYILKIQKYAPVCIASGHARKKDIDCFYYIDKPFSMEDVIEMMEKLDEAS